jgi:uncharacterized membrane protein YraQ (UPF0718 family)
MSFIKNEWKQLLIYLAAFLVIYNLPVGNARFDGALVNAAASLTDYFRHHFLFGLFPAMFIAGALSVFLSSGDIVKYMGAKSNKVVAYLFASVAGLVLSVCSCTVMPLFAGIYRMGAGLGPACTFLFAAPAINIVAVTMTTSVLGFKMGIARTGSAVVFSFFIGLFMAFMFRKEEVERIQQIAACTTGSQQKPLYVNLMFFASLIALFVLAKLYSGAVFLNVLIVITALSLIFTLLKYFKKNDYTMWFISTFEYVKRMLPLFTLGIVASAFLLGVDGKEGVIPASYINAVVGGNGLFATFISSFLGAFIYFCTLIEVPIVQGFMNNGMGEGPALALLLTGPALSLPNMLLIRSVLGTKKTLVFVGTIIILSTVVGYIVGNYF